MDGYDEIFSTRKAELTHNIENFVDRYSSNYFVLTSRPGAEIESLPRFNTFKVKPLSTEQINLFIDKQLIDTGIDKDLAIKLKETIHLPENQDYKSLLDTPLLLSMFILTYNTYPELPKTKSKFYWNVFDTLCTKHDSITKRGGFLHERKSKLQTEDFEKILKWFSFLALFSGDYSFDSQSISDYLNKVKDNLEYKCSTEDLIYDLTTSIGIIVLDGLEYKFPHKSLQEYFTALLIKDQSEHSKIEIYKRKFSLLGNKAMDKGYNLFSLCYELDKIYFIEYYLIEKLEHFLDNFKSLTTQERFKTILKKADIRIEVEVSKSRLGSTIESFLDISLYIIVKFINIDRSPFVNVHQKARRKSSEIIDIVNCYFSENTTTIKLSDNSNKDKMILSVIGVDEKLVNDWFEQLEKALLRLKTDLQKEKDKSSVLLGLDIK